MLQSNVLPILIHCNSDSKFSNSRAWDLLRRILDEKPFVQSHLPFDLVNWITDESRQEMSTTVPLKVEEIEKEVHDFRQRFESDDLNKINGDFEMCRIRWKKWEGEWIPRPIGV